MYLYFIIYLIDIAMYHIYNQYRIVDPQISLEQNSHLSTQQFIGPTFKLKFNPLVILSLIWYQNRPKLRPKIIRSIHQKKSRTELKNIQKSFKKNKQNLMKKHELAIDGEDEILQSNLTSYHLVTSFKLCNLIPIVSNEKYQITQN
ncbi:unnamed protein product (macronuclear) [Paramecium tetraurelia]|uniref:Transmembrane protein n=1 Tax=Paramecium tetraurelia TaxID=5888 RepID=A0CD34_PARTE|nr:uncharacterized protein GSPATT00037486001 [Paramecium tetraurelia]CAK68701.1 unnamed protein product [Paramecium tetraurelia]|eukprot:XP_001436098.1 hypothetical protein (macronuclear) [Paramecium tetraurelia strain d4-2]